MAYQAGIHQQICILLAWLTIVRLSYKIQASVLQLRPALVKGGVLVSVATAQWEEVTGFISPLSR